MVMSFIVPSDGAFSAFLLGGNAVIQPLHDGGRLATEAVHRGLEPGLVDGGLR